MTKLTKKQQRATKAIAAIVLTLIYSINVQSVQTETRHIARNEELETRVEVNRDGSTIY